MSSLKKFDLNIENINEHWNKSHALRELIANALDEHVLTKCDKDIIIKYDNKRKELLIKDFGRGLEAKHLKQNESNEKLGNFKIIGKFGVGLKDAIATLHRNKSYTMIKSHAGMFTFAMSNKNDFKDLFTLHAFIDESVYSVTNGTEIIINNIEPDEVNVAKNFFLLFENLKRLAVTDFGEIYDKTDDSTSKIYVNGVKVAEEERFKFHYNITNINKKIRDAMNRERNNVGRQVYSNRIVQILTRCHDQNVIDLLINDLSNKDEIDVCDEIGYSDVLTHITKFANKTGDTVFMTKSEMEKNFEVVDNIKKEDKKIVLLPDNVCDKISKIKDNEGNNIVTMKIYNSHYNDSFEYSFVEIADLTTNEKAIYNKTNSILGYAGINGHINIKISDNIKNDSEGRKLDYAVMQDHIIIKRNSLTNLSNYVKTLIGACIKKETNTHSLSIEYEDALREKIGFLISKVNL